MDGIGLPILEPCDLSISEVKNCQLNITAAVTIDHDITMTYVRVQCSAAEESCMDLSSGANLNIQTSVLTGSHGARFLYMLRGSKVRIADVVATDFGGSGAVVRATTGENIVVLEHVVMSDNVGLNGGVVLIEGAETLVIRNSNFTGNTANNAGVLRVKKTKVTITDCLFEDNHADLKGGVIYVGGSNVDISSSTFMYNSAGEPGGVIYTYGNGKISITGASVFKENSDSQGDDIYCDHISAEVIIGSNTSISTSVKGNCQITRV